METQLFTFPCVIGHSRKNLPKGGKKYIVDATCHSIQVYQSTSYSPTKVPFYYHSLNMKYSLATLAFGLGASAVTVPRSCTFTLTASGGQSGVVGQLGDGQNRIGGGHPTGSYTVKNGQIIDASGRGCILTPPTSQFQCDVGATPTGGFSVGCHGEVTYNGSSKFYACPATDSEYNIYTTPVAGQTKCVEVELTASGCYTRCSSTPQLSSSATLEPPQLAVSLSVAMEK